MRETISGHRYMETVRSESKLVPGETTLGGTRLTCPRCATKHYPAHHGTPVHCICGLTLTIWGATVEVRDRSDE